MNGIKIKSFLNCVLLVAIIFVATTITAGAKEAKRLSKSTVDTAVLEEVEEVKEVEEPTTEVIETSEEEITPVVEKPRKACPDEIIEKLDAIGNDEINSWIYIPELDFNEPVAQSKDNQDWLRTDLDGNDSVAGTLFFDCMADFNSANPVVYGHNMRDGSKFACLLDLYDNWESVQNRNIFVYTRDGVYRYEIFCVRTTQNDDLAYANEIGSYELGSDEYQTMLDYSIENADISTDATRYVSSDAQTITLSTCYHAVDTADGNGRLIVQAVLVD